MPDNELFAIAATVILEHYLLEYYLTDLYVLYTHEVDRIELDVCTNGT